MTQDQIYRPVPLPDALSGPFWEAAREHRLVVQRCEDCGRYQHPPRVYCLTCQEGTLTFSEVSGQAKVYTHTRVVDSFIPGLEAPYTVIIAELAEQPGIWMLSTCPGDIKVHVGDALELSFEEIAPGVTLPQLLPPGAAGRWESDGAPPAQAARDAVDGVRRG